MTPDTVPDVLVDADNVNRLAPEHRGRSTPVDHHASLFSLRCCFFESRRDSRQHYALAGSLASSLWGLDTQLASSHLVRPQCIDVDFERISRDLLYTEKEESASDLQIPGFVQVRKCAAHVSQHALSPSCRDHHTLNSRSCLVVE